MGHEVHEADNGDNHDDHLVNDVHNDLKHLVNHHFHDFILDVDDTAAWNHFIDDVAKYINDNFLERPRYHEHVDDDYEPVHYVDHDHDGSAIQHEHYGTHSVNYEYHNPHSFHHPAFDVDSDNDCADHP